MKLTIIYEDDLQDTKVETFKCHTYHYDTLIEVIEGYLKGRVDRTREES